MSFNIDPGVSIETETAFAPSFLGILNIGTPPAESSYVPTPDMGGVELVYSSKFIQFKRGLAANLPASALAGEPLFTTDTFRFFVGTGAGRQEYAKLTSASGSFTTVDGKTVTVVSGIITSIV